ncbi:hypothetical protein QQF64_027059, partial [Cirrhinus molitorella]
RCCGCEEGRCSNSQMCESAESKAVSLTRSSLQDLTPTPKPSFTDTRWASNKEEK